MEKSHTEILKDLEAQLQGLKERISAMEEQIAQLQSQPESEEVDFTGEEIGVESIPESESVEIPVEDAEPIEVDPADIEQPVADETAGLPWRKDKPGIPVKNIRSGISLLDRALFINALFEEDATLYDATIAQLNKAETLDEAVAYIREHFPKWDLGSNAVYYFMMAVRKKLG